MAFGVSHWIEIMTRLAINATWLEPSHPMKPLPDELKQLLGLMMP